MKRLIKSLFLAYGLIFGVSFFILLILLLGWKVMLVFLALG